MIANTGTQTREITVLRSVLIERLAWQPVQGCPGVSVKVISRDADIVAALIAYRPQASTPGRPHPADQYIWVVSGEVCIAGRWLDAGSGAHIPAGVAHPAFAGSRNGCLILQLHGAGGTHPLQ